MSKILRLDSFWLWRATTSIVGVVADFKWNLENENGSNHFTENIQSKSQI